MKTKKVITVTLFLAYHASVKASVPLRGTDEEFIKPEKCYGTDEVMDAKCCLFPPFFVREVAKECGALFALKYKSTEQNITTFRREAMTVGTSKEEAKSLTMLLKSIYQKALSGVKNHTVSKHGALSIDTYRTKKKFPKRKKKSHHNHRKRKSIIDQNLRIQDDFQNQTSRNDTSHRNQTSSRNHTSHHNQKSSRNHTSHHNPKSSRNHTSNQNLKSSRNYTSNQNLKSSRNYTSNQNQSLSLNHQNIKSSSQKQNKTSNFSSDYSWTCILNRYHLLNTDKTLNMDRYHAHLDKWIELNPAFYKAVHDARTKCKYRFHIYLPLKSEEYFTFQTCIRTYVNMHCPQMIKSYICDKQKRFYEECADYFFK